MDAVAMIAACLIGQTDQTYVQSCKRCNADTRWGYTYCGLCEIQAELGQWEKPLWHSQYSDL